MLIRPSYQKNTDALIRRVIAKSSPQPIKEFKPSKLFEILELGNEDKVEQLANIFKGAAHPLRLKILILLAEKDFRVLDIRDRIGSSQSNISQHIDILRRYRLINSKKVGKDVTCYLRNRSAVKIILNLGGLDA